MALSEAYVAWETELKGASRQEEKMAIALNMLRDSLPLEQIARFTGLTIAQIQQLQVENP